jgi:hypothetical protein
MRSNVATRRQLDGYSVERGEHHDQVRNWGTDTHARPTEAWICLHVDQIVTFFGDSVDVAV